MTTFHSTVCATNTTIPSALRRDPSRGREDLDMEYQRFTIQHHRRTTLTKANETSYKATIASKMDHTIFLKMLVVEGLRQFHLANNAAAVDGDVRRHNEEYVKAVLSDIDVLQESADTDQYSSILDLIAKEHLFHPEWCKFREI